MQSIDPIQSAELVGLRYVSDDRPGIQRQASEQGFVYISANGKPIRNAKELQRIQSLIIPPAWENVWICPLPDGHLQATGRDAKGRKQYRYHTNWRLIRSQTKFDHMLQFGLALPKIREQTDLHLRLRGLCREKVLATVVQLLEKTLIRVGNSEYAEKNRSFGLTTLRNRHIQVSGSTLKFQFRGKSGVDHDIELGDRRLAKIVKQCRDLPGYELFQYLDDQGQRQTIDSKDVNAYLRKMTAQDFTAKDFRTWGGTVKAFLALKVMGEFSSETEAKKQITQAVKDVARELGNRPATCRKYYIHPAILAAYVDGRLLSLAVEAEKETIEVDSTTSKYSLCPEEQAVLALIEQSA